MIWGEFNNNALLLTYYYYYYYQVFYYCFGFISIKPHNKMSDAPARSKRQCAEENTTNETIS